ncbi:MAG: FliM/FliN family flagellar motor switch protein [Desulfotomaculales bacterium]
MMISEEEIRKILKRFTAGPAAPEVPPVRLPELTPPPGDGRVSTPLAYLDDVQVDLAAELGGATLKVRDILALQEGSVIELDRPAGDNVDILLNGLRFARGEVMVINNLFAIRVSSIHPPQAGEATGDRA